jgi:Ran GTPase-activating protein (RanGAP) involved in mRNA processing and transport
MYIKCRALPQHLHMPRCEETTPFQSVGFQLDWSENQLDNFVCNELIGNVRLANLQVDRTAYQTLGKDRILSVLNSLADPRAKLEQLELEENDDLGVTGALAVMKVLSCTTTLQMLTIRHCTLPKNAWELIMDGISDSVSIRDVNLSYNQLGYGDLVWRMMASFANVRNLRRLDLSHNGIRIGGKVATALGHLLAQTSTLQYLDIGGSAKSLNNSKNQAGLSMRQGDGMAEFVQGLKQNTTLQVLKLSRSRICAVEAHALIEALTHNTSLRHLNLSGNWVSSRALEALATLLDANSCLTLLDISSCYFPMIDDSQDVRGAVAISKALAQHVSLRNLNLSGNHLRRVDTYAIAACLLKNTALHTLKLRNIASVKAASPWSYDIISSTQADNARSSCEILPILMYMCQSKHLRHVDVGNNRIDDELATSLAEALKMNHSLQYLDISRNCLIRKSGMGALCDVLETNDTMLVLRLGELHDSDSVHALTSLLLRNNTLQLLDITCHFGLEYDFSSVIKALARNATLQHLALNGNLQQKGANEKLYCDDAVLALAEIAKTNATLTTVCMRCNPSPHVVHTLFKTLQHVPRFTPLHIHGFDVSMPIYAHGFDNRLARNSPEGGLPASELISKRDVPEYAGAKFFKDHPCSSHIRGDTVLNVHVCEPIREACEYVDACSLQPDRTRGMHGEEAMGVPVREKVRQECAHVDRCPAACEPTLQVCAYADLMWAWRDTHCEKAFAFAMGNHCRLGRGSLIRHMNWDCVRMVVLSFFGMPLYSCHAMHEESDYVSVLAALTPEDN